MTDGNILIALLLVSIAAAACFGAALHFAFEARSLRRLIPQDNGTESIIWVCYAEGTNGSTSYPSAASNNAATLTP